MVTPAMDLTDILRAEIVMIVSALDHYIHELARLGMLEVFHGKRTPTPSFRKFDVSLDHVLAAMGGSPGPAWLETEIRTNHGFQSFQHPEKIADAVRLFSSVELWKAVGSNLGEDPKVVKTKLLLLVDRRNKIAHEADLDPTFPGVRWPISPGVVEEAIEFVAKLCEAIDAATV